MSWEETIGDLKIPKEQILQDIAKVDEQRKKLEEKLEETGEKTKDTWMIAVGVAQASWNLMDGILTAAGVTISGVTRAVIQGAFSAVQIFTPIITAAAVTPGMQILAAIGAVQIGLAIAAAVAAEREQKEVQTGLTVASGMISNVVSFAGSFK